MCGRYTLKSDGRRVAGAFGLAEFPDLAERYNIAPTQNVPVVLEENGRKLEAMHWGLIPSWSKDPGIGARMINARAETVAEKPSYRSAFKRRRCLVVADGFYEWKKIENDKQPYHLKMKDGGLFGFAGLWESWSMEGGEEILSCTIITTEANEVAAEVHNRMPVILPPDMYGAWLNPENGDREELLSMLVPYPAEEMEAYAVNRSVNRPANDYPEVLEPV